MLNLDVWAPPAVFVTCDTPSGAPDKAQRPGNFKIVIQNILYLGHLSPTRCSVSQVGRIPGSSRLSGLVDLPESARISRSQGFDLVGRRTGIFGLVGPLNIGQMCFKVVASP